MIRQNARSENGQHARHTPPAPIPREKNSTHTLSSTTLSCVTCSFIHRQMNTPGLMDKLRPMAETGQAQFATS